MKLLLNSIILLTAFWTFAEEDEYIMSNYYYVVSDEQSANVPEGKCLVKGQVIDPYSEKGVSGGLVANLTRTSYAVTDDSGYYQITIPATDTTVFFYHKKYNEIICWSYPFQSKHEVAMNFVTSEKLPDGVIMEVEKPVIYLYPESTTQVEVKLDEELNLTTTYPKYNDKWEVTVQPDGTLTSKGRSYPYLYYEAEKNDFQMLMVQAQLPGQMINTDSTVKYMENTLSNLGLNNRESTDFITYWGPRIKSYNFAFVQFLIDETYDIIIGDLNVNPEPEAIRRVYILFEGYAEAPNRESTIVDYEPLKREGFTVIEWGGTEIKSKPKP